MQTELQNPTDQIDGLKRQLEQEAKRRAWLENLVTEAIRHQYLDRVSCPPTWIKEAELALQ